MKHYWPAVAMALLSCALCGCHRYRKGYMAGWSDGLDSAARLCELSKAAMVKPSPMDKLERELLKLERELLKPRPSQPEAKP